MKQLERRNALMCEIRALQDELDELDGSILAQLKDKVKPLGSTTTEFEGTKVIVTIPAYVKWDQRLLRDIASNISKGGDDPEDFIDYALKVKETSYKAWPEAVQNVFTPARTVTPGKAKIEVKA